MPVLTIDQDDVGQRVLKKHDHLRSQRSNWEGHWEEIARFVVPKKDDVWMSNTSGEKKGNTIFTGMPVHANEALAAALHGMLTNPSSVWFGLGTGDKEIDERPEVKKWMQHAVDRMIQTLNNSNFQTQIHEVYIDLGSFGTSLLLIEEDKELTVRFLSRPIYMAYIDENFKGMVDTVSFERRMNARSIIQEFGEDAVNQEIIDKAAQQPQEEMRVIHLVEPRESFDPSKKNVTNKPFASFHVIKDTGWVLKESGFDELPYVVPRWTKISGELYGRSPAMTALPDIKMLNAMKKAVIKGAQKVVDPVLQVPDDGVLLPLRTGPGDINYYRAGTKDRIEPLNTGARPDIGESIIAGVEEDINKAFFIDQLQIREADRMTATEIIQRREEQLRKLGPILGRQHFELLKPLVDRVFNIMARNKKFDPAPEAIQGLDLEVKYVSQIARAQITSDADDLVRVVSLIEPLAAAKPGMLDNFDEDAIVRDIANKFNLPSEYIRETDAVKAIRTGRRKARQQEEAANAQNPEVAVAQQAADGAPVPGV